MGIELLIGKSTPVEYVPRQVWCVGGNLERAGEDAIKGALDELRFSLLLGLSGVGKSMTAEYLARKYVERGHVAIRLIPVSEGNRIGVEVTNYGVVRVYFPVSLGMEERFLRLAYGFSKLADVRKVKDEGFLRRIANLFEKVKRLKGLVERRKIAEEMSGIVEELAESFEESFEGFECGSLDEEKLVTFFELVKGVSMDLGIASAKNILDFVGGLLPSVSVIINVILLVTGLVEVGEALRKGDLAEEVEKGLRKGVEGKEVLLIVDDYADTGGYSGAFFKFLSLCYGVGMRVFVVMRIELRDFVKISKSRRKVWTCVNLFRGGGGDEPLWGMGSKSLERCIFLMDRCELEEFVEIVRSNWNVIAVKRGRLGKEVNVRKIDLGEWYRKTFGIPFLALTLMCYRDADELRAVGGEGTYYKRPFPELGEEEAEELSEAMIWRFLDVFESIWREDFELIPVILQPVAEDEAREFYKMMGRGNVEELEFNPCVRIYYEEKWKDGYVRVFGLTDANIKLHELFNLLEEIDAKIDGKSVRTLIGRWRYALLKVMTEKSLEAGGLTRRMLLSALKHIGRLRGYGKVAVGEEFDDWHLHWLGYCLQFEPDLGMVLAREGLEVAKRRKGTFALAFLRDLARRCTSYGDAELIADLWRILEGFECGSRAEKAWKIIAKADALHAIFYHREKLKDSLGEIAKADRILKEFDELLKECEGLGGLKDYVSSWVRLNKARVLINIGLLKPAMEELERALNCECSPDEEFLRPLGGDSKEKARRNTDALKALVHYNRGIVLRDLGDIEGAVREFKKAKEIYERLENRANALKSENMLVALEILGASKVEDIVGKVKEIMVKAEEIWHELDLQSKSGLCGEYAVSMALSGFGEEDVKRLERLLWTINFDDLSALKWLSATVGVLALLGSLDVLKIIFNGLKWSSKVLAKILEDVPDDREKAITLMYYYDLKISKFLEKKFERRWKIVEKFDKLIEEFEKDGMNKEDAMKRLEMSFGGTISLRFARKLYKKNAKNAKMLVRLTTTESSLQDFIRILWILAPGEYDVAYILSVFYLEKLLYCEKPMLAKLYYDLAIALKEIIEGKARTEDASIDRLKEAQEKLKNAVVKLFYYHI